ncbi:hypothetical protein AB0F93_00060 [Micromonospora tulbaghiae]|uniref:hypothetical protein n=1 Tax=Micromonospora tulbaghiae TaxID=479978 RepID=UPI00331AD26A
MPAKATYSAGTAYLTVTPSFRGVEDAMEAEVRKAAQKVDKDLSAAMAKGMRDAAKQAKGVGRDAGADFAGAYDREAKKHLNAAWKALPKPQPDMDMRKWDRKLAVVRREMKDLSELRVGVDIDQKSFDTAVRQFRERLTQLRDTAPRNSSIGWFNAAQAEAELGLVQKFTSEAARRGGEAGDGFGSAFNKRMAKVLRDAAEAIPPMKIDADSTDAERKLADVADRIHDLGSARIGIDVDAATAYAELRAIAQELQRLDRRDVRVDIRTNAHDAALGMAQFIKQAEEAGKATERIGRSANFSMSRLGYLIMLGASLGTSVVPAAAAAAAAIGSIGTMAAAGASGVGVFALGLSGVGEAVKLLNQYENDQEKSANSLNQSQRRVASSTDQVRMAQLSLANTRRSIAQQEEDSARRIADAERNVGEVRRQNQRDALAAARAVADSQKAVTRAEEDARDVRRQLNSAIADAVRNMAELDTALGRNQVEQDKAVTAQMQALHELNALKENPRATEVELRRARDSYNEQSQRLRELRDEQKNLTAERSRGVEGDDRVVAARKRIADVDERVADARERLDRAREAQQEQAYQGARRLADAQRQVADAHRAQARQQADAQYQLAQAAQAVTAAQRTQEQAWEKAGIAGGEALDNLNWQMSQLSPEAQRFAQYLFGLKDEVLGLRDAAAAPLLPRLEEAITGLLPYLPGFTDYVGKVSAQMGDLAIESVNALGNPVWRRFFGYLDDSAVPTLQMLYDTGMNTAEGLASLYLALTPFDRPIGEGLVDMTERFARWAENLNRTQGYREFLEYVRENGPNVLHFLGETALLLFRIVEAGAPLGEKVLQGLTLLVDGINSLPLPVLTALVTAIGLVSFGLTALGAVMRVVKLKQQLTDIFGPRMAKMVSTYAIETGRATEETRRFGKATATANGMAAAGARRFEALASAVGGPVVRGFNASRLAVTGVAEALNSRYGFTTAAALAAARARDLGETASTALTSGMVRTQIAVNDATTALDARGGFTGVMRDARAQAIGFTAAAEVAANNGINRMRTSARSFVQEFRAGGGMEGALDRGQRRVVGFAAAAELAARTGVDRLRTSTRNAVQEFRAGGGLEGALARTQERVVAFTAATEVAARQGLPRMWTSATTAAVAFSERTGLSGAVSAAQGRVVAFGNTVAGPVRSGLDRLRVTALTTAAAFNGPTGLAGAVSTAGQKVSAFGATAAGAARSGLGQLRTAGANLVGFMGGPWGVALALGTTLITGIAQSMAEWKSKTKDMETVLQDLGHSLHDMQTAGGAGGADAARAVTQIIDRNPDMRRAVLTLRDMGLGFDQLGRAAQGSKPDLDATLSVIDEAIAKTEAEWRDKSNFLLTVFSTDARDAAGRLATLRQLRQASLDNAKALDIQAKAQQAANEASGRYQAVQRFVGNSSVTSNLAVQNLTYSFDQNQKRIEALTAVTKTFGDVQSTGAQRADALRMAIDTQSGSAIRATEANETFAQKLLSLRDTVNSAKGAHDKHATSLDLNSQTALRNRDALQEAAGAARELWLEDIAAGVPMDQATKRHGDRITALKEEAKRLGLTKDQTDALIKKYGEIDPKITTVYETQGFDKAYKELEYLKFMQDAVAKGWSLEKAKAAWNAQEWHKKGFQGPVFIPAKAEGGPIEGPGGPTSDDVLMWGSNGEWVHQAKAVDYYGPGFMEAINERRIPKEWLPGYATGGPVGGPPAKGGLPAYADGGLIARYIYDVKDTPMLTLDEALAVIGGGGPLGGATGSQGWRWQIAVLRKAFPGLTLHSGFRANSYTASGGLSWHSRDGGRAVDVPPRQDVFNFIHDTYGKGTKELIWGGAPERNIYHGKHYRFSDSLLYQHGPYRGKPGPSPHIHWAFDDGGQLLPGWNLVPNFTGKPEPVLSPGQWKVMEEFVSQGMAGGGRQTHHHYEFANSTLDEQRVRDMQRRDDALARADRDNW